MTIRPLNAAMVLLPLAFLLPAGELAAQLPEDVAGAEVRFGQSFAEPLIEEESFGLLRGSDSNAFAVFSKQQKRWSTFHFPKQLRVQPMSFGEYGPHAPPNAIIGFAYANGPVAELVAVDTRGRFRKYTLEEPLNREIKPFMMGHSVLYYIVDGTIYAFSGITGTWDALRTPNVPEVNWSEDGSGVPPGREDGFDTASVNGILVKTSRGLMKFVADVGVWQLADDADWDLASLGL